MKDNTRKSSNAKKIATVVALGCIFTAIALFTIRYSKDKAKQEKLEERRSSKICQDLYKDAYEGAIVRAKKNQLRIRKLDDTKFKEFNYFFKKPYNVSDHFYNGQKVYKQANSEFFSADLKEFGRKEFNIPCWE